MRLTQLVRMLLTDERVSLICYQNCRFEFLLDVQHRCLMVILKSCILLLEGALQRLRVLHPKVVNECHVRRAQRYHFGFVRKCSIMSGAMGLSQRVLRVPVNERVDMRVHTTFM